MSSLNNKRQLGDDENLPPNKKHQKSVPFVAKSVPKTSNSQKNTSKVTTNRTRVLRKGSGSENLPAQARPTGAPLRTRSAVKSKISTAVKDSAVNLAKKAVAAAKKLAGNKSENKEPQKKKARAGWDIKGMLEDAKTENKELRDSIEQLNKDLSEEQNRIKELETKVSEMDAESEQKEATLAEKRKLIGECQEKLAVVDQERQETRRKHESEVENVRHQLVLEMSNLSTNITLITSEKKQMESILSDREAKIIQLEKDTTQVQGYSAEVEARLREEEKIRRRLHNTIQELKGNIRVFCRVRPSVREDELPHLKFPDSGATESKRLTITQLQQSADGTRTTEKQFPFEFDLVFRPQDTQKTVFAEISQLVQSALEGYPVCVFAYGQTGSGKTFTMEGPADHTEETLGMIPRTVDQIFEASKELESKGWMYIIEAQFLEIYNEAIHDLLSPNGLDGNKKHEIRHQNGKTTVTEMTVVQVDKPAKVRQLLEKAGQNRAVAATQCNERSSRSHSVFTLRLTGRNSTTEEVSEGVLNLVDLAGSERLSVSGATGDRLKETQAINKSLSSLGDVIQALGNVKEGHVPYRNSKLTYLLQNSLGGNSKTLMFVNVNPAPESVGETLSSLRFATKVNSTQIGTAKRQAK